VVFDMDEPEEVSAEDFQVQRALLGIETESFWKSKVGRYIHDRIDVELEQFRDSLENCRPGESDKILGIQTDIRIRRLLEKFINEAIASGVQAERELEHEDTPTY